MAKAKKARAVGFNHVALEVGDIEEALAFYGRLFDFKLRSAAVLPGQTNYQNRLTIRVRLAKADPS